MTVTRWPDPLIGESPLLTIVYISCTWCVHAFWQETPPSEASIIFIFYTPFVQPFSNKILQFKKILVPIARENTNFPDHTQEIMFCGLI